MTTGMDKFKVWVDYTAAAATGSRVDSGAILIAEELPIDKAVSSAKRIAKAMVLTPGNYDVSAIVTDGDNTVIWHVSTKALR